MKTRFLPFVLLPVFAASALAAAPNVHQWQWRNPLPQGNDLLAVAYGNGRYVAVGDYGAILSSADGVDWAVHSLDAGVFINGVAYGNGTFLAVGQGYFNRTNFSFGPDLVLTSPDGRTWTERPTGQTNNFKSVAFGNGLFVAVGSTWPNLWPYTNTILTSVDGVNWTARNAAVNPGLTKVSFGGGRFVAVGDNDSVQTSTDGINWTAFTVGGILQNVAFGGGLWIAVGYTFTGSGYATFITSSPDAINWTVRHVGSQQPAVYAPLRAVAYGNGQFVAMGTEYFETESNFTMVSSDGRNWERAPDLPILQRPTALLHAGGQFVAVGEFGNIATSPDGNEWTGRSRATSNNLRGIAYGNGIFVAVGNTGTNLVSSNGTLWTGHKSGTDRNLREVTYAGQFVAVGSDGAIVTSPTGADWTAQGSGTTEGLWDVSFGNGMFVAVGGNSSGDNRLHRIVVVASSDGVNWTTRLSNASMSSLSFELHGVTFGNGRFVAVGRPAAILTSFDGMNWFTNFNVPEFGAYRGIL